MSQTKLTLDHIRRSIGARARNCNYSSHVYTFQSTALPILLTSGYHACFGARCHGHISASVCGAQWRWATTDGLINIWLTHAWLCRPERQSIYMYKFYFLAWGLQWKRDQVDCWSNRRWPITYPIPCSGDTQRQARWWFYKQSWGHSSRIDKQFYYKLPGFRVYCWPSRASTAFPNQRQSGYFLPTVMVLCVLIFHRKIIGGPAMTHRYT